MFEIESKNQDEIIISTKTTTVKINVKEGVIDANLSVGRIHGPGEFEIGEVSIRGIATPSQKTIYDAEIGGGNVDGMVSELKLSARTEKKLKVKNLDSLPPVKEVVVLN